ncbi:papain-like cysteine protease family protein [Verrucosispora sioxanthis]|uniref:papain-like cysteine protease family protein n=1 Tax=Verrucosispora sioxanthis TaxID=2499994 RepID=UPI001C1071DD|nr:papain-like cysteine protease family protein [Verrucosispora sioxanthis]
MSLADLRNIGNTPIRFESTSDPRVFLRMDGTGVPTTMAGGGTVNCNFDAAEKEKFKLHHHGNDNYSIESIAFPGKFLRMVASDVNAQKPTGGIVNCQINANGGGHETFRFRAQNNGSYSIESLGFPNVFLRMLGGGVTTHTAQGGGTVNCRFDANGGAETTFKISMADQSLNFANAQLQSQNMWCWAASSVNIARFYDPNTPHTQCAQANAQFGQNGCCNVAQASGAACNRGAWPTNALTRMGHLREEVFAALTVQQVAAELAQSQPVGVDTHWRNGGGHIVVIWGRWESGGVEWLRIHDPWDGFVDVTFDNFRDNYTASGGVWARSYRTVRQA